MIRSPFPDVEIPDMPFTDFVLARAGERGDKAALIDGPSGRTITYPELVESVRGLAAGWPRAASPRATCSPIYAPNLPEYAVAFHGVATAGGVNTTANPLMTGGGARQAARGLGRAAARDRARAPREGHRGGRSGRASRRSSYTARPRARRRSHRFVQAGGGAAAGRDRSRQGSDRAAVLERHDRAPQGRDADAPEPRREHLLRAPTRPPSPRRCEEYARERAIAVLPFFHIYGLVVLMNIPLYRGATVVTMPRFDLAEFLRADPGLPDHARLGGAADRAGDGQASASRRVRPVEPRVRELGRRAAVGRARGGLR